MRKDLRTNTRMKQRMITESHEDNATLCSILRRCRGEKLVGELFALTLSGWMVLANVNTSSEREKLHFVEED